MVPTSSTSLLLSNKQYNIIIASVMFCDHTICTYNINTVHYTHFVYKILNVTYVRESELNFSKIS